MKAQTFENGNGELEGLIRAAAAEVDAWATAEFIGPVRSIGWLVQRDLVVEAITFDPPVRVYRVFCGQTCVYTAPRVADADNDIPRVSRVDLTVPVRVQLGSSISVQGRDDLPNATAAIVWDHDALAADVRRTFAERRRRSSQASARARQPIQDWFSVWRCDGRGVLPMVAIDELIDSIIEVGFSPFSYAPRCPRCGSSVGDAGPAHSPNLTPPLCLSCAGLPS
jgi:hypothetical protein